jgi:dTDP-4-amino-4,6-dideoxygalactose transaminase
VTAAFLYAQLEDADAITARRLALWAFYHDAFAALEAEGRLRRPVVPAWCTHSAHLYYLLLPDRTQRDRLIAGLGEQGVNAVFHYVPLHTSPAGRRYGRAHGELAVTLDATDRLVRLPLFVDMREADAERVVEAVHAALDRPLRFARTPAARALGSNV